MDTPGEAPRPNSSEPSSAEASPASLIDLLLTTVQALGVLITGKLRLAEQELSQDLGTVAKVAGFVAVATLLLVLALGLAGAGLAMVISPWVGSVGLALLLVAGIYLLAGAIIVLVARARIRKMGGFLSETRADLKRDAEWLKTLS